MWLIPTNGRGLPTALEAKHALTLGLKRKRAIAVALKLVCMDIQMGTIFVVIHWMSFRKGDIRTGLQLWAEA
jgi:hypothetical protein